LWFASSDVGVFSSSLFAISFIFVHIERRDHHFGCDDLSHVQWTKLLVILIAGQIKLFSFQHVMSITLLAAGQTFESGNP
jgi:hypothetical protein